jgi:hypothetical protein
MVILAIGARLLLLPLSHTWDGQTWVNVFAELAATGSPLDGVARPYATMRELSLLTQAAGHHTDFYEYWAYPPLMLYVYWPLAHLYTSLGASLQPTFVVQPAMVAPSIPLPLLALIRLPNLLAELGSFYIMRALGVSVAGLRWYAFNPFVLLVGVWTFDPVMVAFLLLGLLLAVQQRWVLAGAALALGGATKFVPLAVLPALVVAILYRQRTWQRGIARVLVSLTACCAVLAVLIAPVADDFVYVLRFHAQRFGTGLTVEQIWATWAQQFAMLDWQPGWQLYASVQTGALLLPLALLGACVVMLRARLPIETAFLVLVLAFLAGAKVVNEAYVLVAVALATVELARRPSPGMANCRTLLWLVAFVYAALNTPAWAFLLSAIQQVQPTSGPAIQDWLDGYRQFRALPGSSLPYAVLGVVFEAVLAIGIWVAARPGRVLSFAERRV